MPGEHVESYMLFTKEMPAKNIMPFTVREHSDKTVARGLIKEVLPPIPVSDFKELKNFEEFLKK